ncbi:MAG: histone deacetylase, partial [bacterium]|nr:histone deacetylase [bacterium]
MASFWQRFRARRRLHGQVRFWYHPRYDAPSLGETVRTLGVVTERAQRIVNHLLQAKLIKQKDLPSIPWVPLTDLRLFHPQKYLESVSEPKILGRIFGLEPHEVHVDELLTAQRWALSGTLAAAKAVINKKVRIAFNLGGGFHHAEPEQGSGFCVYNDIAIAVAKLREGGFSEPISIVDLDYHQGNGNTVAFSEDETVGVFSIHGSVWTHVEGKHDVNYHLPEHTKDEDYLNALAGSLPQVLESHKPQLLFYLAGNDVLKGDPLGGFDLSLEGLYRRDRFVVDWALEHQVPLVVTLAGGYSRHALLGSLNLIHYLLGDEEGISLEEEGIKERILKIAKTLPSSELQKEGESEFKFSEEDILGSLDRHGKQRKILGYYSGYGIELALEKYGLFQKVRELGYGDFHITIDPADPSRQLIRLEARPLADPKSDLLLLAEMVLRKASMPFPQKFRSLETLQLLSIEWLLLQDPLRPFSLRNPKFPGQKHPGLGIAQEIQEIFNVMCLRLNFDGVLNHPSY